MSCPRRCLFGKQAGLRILRQAKKLLPGTKEIYAIRTEVGGARDIGETCVTGVVIVITDLRTQEQTAP